MAPRPPPRTPFEQGSGTIPGVRRPGIVVAAVAAAAAMAALVAGSAGAQTQASIAVTPAEADPGGTVVVANGPGAPCTPPDRSTNASASVDLYASGSATPANWVPFQGLVSPSGTWSVEVRLAPDLPPGPYRVQAACYSDSGLNSGFGPTYESARLDLRLQSLGPPATSVRQSRPGDSVQITSGDAGCKPPAGAPSPRVRVSLLDGGGATRAETEGPVESATGRWSLPLKVPAIDTPNAQITAVCLARVGAPAPYARYSRTIVGVDAQPVAPPVPPPVSVEPPPIPPAPVPGGPVTSTTLGQGQVAVSSLPLAPVAKPIVAEPTYTG